MKTVRTRGAKGEMDPGGRRKKLPTADDPSRKETQSGCWKSEPEVCSLCLHNCREASSDEMVP